MRPTVNIYPFSINFTFAYGGAPPLSIELSPGQENNHQPIYYTYLRKKSDNQQHRAQQRYGSDVEVKRSVEGPRLATQISYNISLWPRLAFSRSII